MHSKAVSKIVCCIRLRKKVALSNLTEIGIMNLVSLYLGIYTKVRESAFVQSFLEIIKEGEC